jgi:hypothetical protein
MYRNQNAIRQLRTKQSDKSLNLKLDEYKAKFLVA